MGRIGVVAAMSAALAASGAMAGEAPSFDATFETTAATDYYSDGLTQSDHEAVLQPKLSVSSGLFYGSVALSNVDFGAPDPDVEWEVIAGIAPTLGNWTFDLSLTRYQYPGDVADQYTYLFGSAAYDLGNGLSLTAGYAYYWYDAGADYNELYAAADLALAGDVTLHGEASYDIDYDGAGNDYVGWQGGIVAPLPKGFEVSANLGYEDYFTDPATPSYLWYDVGVSFAFTDWAKLDLRYYGNDLDGEDCPAFTDTDCDSRAVAALKLSWKLPSAGALAPSEPDQPVRPLAAR